MISYHFHAQDFVTPESGFDPHDASADAPGQLEEGEDYGKAFAPGQYVVKYGTRNPSHPKNGTQRVVTDADHLQVFMNGKLDTRL